MVMECIYKMLFGPLAIQSTSEMIASHSQSDGGVAMPDDSQLVVGRVLHSGTSPHLVRRSRGSNQQPSFN